MVRSRSDAVCRRGGDIGNGQTGTVAKSGDDIFNQRAARAGKKGGFSISRRDAAGCRQDAVSPPFAPRLK